MSIFRWSNCLILVCIPLHLPPVLEVKVPMTFEDTRNSILTELSKTTWYCIVALNPCCVMTCENDGFVPGSSKHSPESNKTGIRGISTFQKKDT
ncbi:hypothetical protein J6590_035023 [Homalodisca vitripennis]|nr:hypothetical protein J6590_035023 [Homalodisca vitripennis]